MSTRDRCRWMEAQDAGGKFFTDVMLVPDAALVRTRVRQAYEVGGAGG